MQALGFAKGQIALFVHMSNYENFRDPDRTIIRTVEGQAEVAGNSLADTFIIQLMRRPVLLMARSRGVGKDEGQKRQRRVRKRNRKRKRKREGRRRKGEDQ